MSFHHNEKDEWLGYGAGIYLSRCDKFSITGTTILRGQCGLMMSSCNNGSVRDNSFSFLSAIGVGMYRSSGNKIINNSIDYCVRGYSHGVYNRGQDSAGILIYEQSNKNIFAFNSVTHGGDGFFLWAGQTTMDTGKGGCNDNLIAYNDFSHAVTNGIEATFSRNKFIGNLVMECWHGVWGGFSYDSVFRDNVFALNGEAIAIEHGPNNKISRNIFLDDRVGIHLWENATIDPNWGYGKVRDCKSHDTLITENQFLGTGRAIHLKRTIGTIISRNSFNLQHQDVLKQEEQSESVFLSNTLNLGGMALDTVGFDPSNAIAFSGKPVTLNYKVDSNGVELESLSQSYDRRWTIAIDRWKAILGGTECKELARSVGFHQPYMLSLASGFERGRRNIIVDDWGPYDFASPKLVLRKKASSGDMTSLSYSLLGTRGPYHIMPIPNAKVSQSDNDFKITVPEKQYAGLEVSVKVGGKTYKWVNTEVATPWSVKFYAWDPKTQDPRTQGEAFAQLLKGTPLETATSSRLNYASSGNFLPKLPSNNFATIAETEINVPAGTYSFGLTSDDGCRVWLDGKLQIDEWHYQGPTHYDRTWNLSKGKHKILIHHFEIDGYATLAATVRKK
ncbi:MAG: right-handed parallel beta-helix repeat-containing protein [Armatimonadetes bacterium]|nr:right-handed parallel beta-helix repeat-containing protein [Armatimonadota bacterium]